MLTPNDIAKYFLLKTEQDGELISPLKMQKLVYYAYAWHLVKTKEKLFSDQIEAWANGPVVPSLYVELKKFGSSTSPIDLENFVDINTEVGAANFVSKIPPATKANLDEVYERYQTMTAFELVVLTHDEKPWAEARKGLEPGEKSSNPILDQHIIEQYLLV